MAGDPLPSHVVAFREWQHASRDEKTRLIRSYVDYTEMLPSLEALRDPENIIAPNGKRLTDCAGAELTEFAAWYQAIRNAAVDRAAAVDRGAALAGIRL